MRSSSGGDRRVARWLAALLCFSFATLFADEPPSPDPGRLSGIHDTLERAGPRRVYLLGDATHGSREFYLFRQAVTRELITAHGARRLVLEIESDEAESLDRWLTLGFAEQKDAAEMLGLAIRRWPRWIWANSEVAGFMNWLRRHNRTMPLDDRVRLSGMDLKGLDNDASVTYADLMAEDPYRAWNYRAEYMARRVLDVLADRGPVVVWAHNNHVGDKRADDTRDVHLVSVGQLLRESLSSEHVLIIGTAADRGGYIAAPRWGEPWQAVEMEQALEGSVARALAGAGIDASLLDWARGDRALFPGPAQYHRGIGVISLRGASNQGTYVRTDVFARYDALAYFPRVAPIRPLE